MDQNERNLTPEETSEELKKLESEFEEMEKAAGELGEMEEDEGSLLDEAVADVAGGYHFVPIVTSKSPKRPTPTPIPLRWRA